MTIGGQEVDLSKLPQFTIGHKRALFKDHGVDLRRVGQFNPEEEFAFVLFMLRLVRPETTEEEVAALPMGAIARVVNAMLENETRG